MPLIDWYLGFVLAFLTLQLVVAVANAKALQKPKAFGAGRPDADLPSISVLVPARDEENHIQACVESLLSMNYHDFEVVVLDDGSTDDTYSILCRLRDRDHRLRVLVGSELPDGWYGKPHACWQLANAARGTHLLFTDADCRLAPDALLLALGGSLEHEADVVSLCPELVCRTFWERAVLPLMYYIVFGFIWMPLVRHSRHPWFAGANGAFLFLRRDTYFEIDGHRAVRNQLAEDIKFAQHVKRSGKTLWYGDGSRTYSVRMYEGLAQIWAGFSKNIFPAFSRNLPLLLLVLGIVTATLVAPPFALTAGLATGARWTWAAAVAVVLPILIRLAISARFRLGDWPEALLVSVGWAVVVAMGLNSARQSLFGQGNEWKGRSYGPVD